MQSDFRAFPWRVWLLCFLALACFCQRSSNPNITTRIGLTLSIIGEHKLTIDRFAPYTVDKAEFDGHAYADKAPGLSLLAIPFAAAMRSIVTIPSAPFDSEGANYKLVYAALIEIVDLAIVSALTATAAALLFRWCRLRGASPAAAVFASLTYALATPVFWWSTTFFGHAPASALLLIGFVLLSESLVPQPIAGDTGPIPNLAFRALLGGSTLGLAFFVEVTSGPAVALVAVGCGADALLHRTPIGSIVSKFLVSALGLMWPLLFTAMYNWAAFGSPVHLGYGSVEDFPGMKSGFFGVSIPDLSVAYELLFGQYRGLLPLAPIVVLVPIGVVVALGNRQWRAAAVTGPVVFLFYLLLTAGYYYWWGGFSTGPRHLVPGLALLTIPLAPLWDRVSPSLRWVGMVLLGVSAVIAALLAGLRIDTPDTTHHPLTDVWWPMLKNGLLPRLLANVVGIHGYWGFIPLILVWGVVGLPLLRLLWRSTSTRTLA